MQLWLLCRKYGAKAIAMDGTVLYTPVLPYTGGIAEQDAETILAFEVADEVYREIELARERRKAAGELVQGLAQNAPTPPLPTAAPPPPLDSILTTPSSSGAPPPASRLAPPTSSKQTFTSTAERGIPQVLPIPVIS